MDATHHGFFILDQLTAKSVIVPPGAGSSEGTLQMSHEAFGSLLLGLGTAHAATAFGAAMPQAVYGTPLFHSEKQCF